MSSPGRPVGTGLLFYFMLNRTTCFNASKDSFYQLLMEAIERHLMIVAVKTLKNLNCILSSASVSSLKENPVSAFELVDQRVFVF